jgi:hypothetical protein
MVEVEDINAAYYTISPPSDTSLLRIGSVSGVDCSLNSMDDDYGVSLERSFLRSTGQGRFRRPPSPECFNCHTGHQPREDRFVVDSGANIHVTNSLRNIEQHVQPTTNRRLDLQGIGPNMLRTTHKGTIPHIGKLLVVPAAKRSLLSLRELSLMGYDVQFDTECVRITNSHGTTVRGLLSLFT